MVYLVLLITRRRRFAGAERGSRFSQIELNIFCERMRATEHAPRGLFQIFEGRNGLAEITERGAGVLVERPRVNFPHPEPEEMILFENTLRHRYHFSQQLFDFFVAVFLF